MRVGIGSFSLALAATVAGCASEPCTVSEEGVITCPDGTTTDLSGPDGAAGANGLDGVDGADGEQGPAGPAGPDETGLVVCAGGEFAGDDVLALAGCQKLTGRSGVFVSTAEQLAALDGLEEVFGDLTIVTSGLTEVQLPALRQAVSLTVSAGGFFGIAQVAEVPPPVPATISLPALQVVGDQLRISVPSSTVLLPALDSAGNVAVAGAVAVELPELRYADGLSLDHINEQFARLVLADDARLGRVGIRVEGVPGCTFASMPAIAAACEADNCSIVGGSNEGTACDNCADVANDDQADVDQDGVGDVCDDDVDGDGVANDDDVAPLRADRCTDADNDGCDDCTFGVNDPANDGFDEDGDGLCNTSLPGDCLDQPGALFCFNGRTYDESQQLCQSFGLDLPVFHTVEERRAFERAVNPFGGVSQEYWAGLTDRVSEGSFLWVDGTPMSAEDAALFVSGEPNNNGNEDCVDVVPTIGLIDISCDLRLSVLCPVGDTPATIKRDNCAQVSNPDQLDTDGDKQGDACDPCPNDRFNGCT